MNIALLGLLFCNLVFLAYYLLSFNSTDFRRYSNTNRRYGRPTARDLPPGMLCPGGLPLWEGGTEYFRTEKQSQDSGASLSIDCEDQEFQNDDARSTDIYESGPDFMARLLLVLLIFYDVTTIAGRGSRWWCVFCWRQSSSLLNRSTPLPVFKEESASTSDETTPIELFDATSSGRSSFPPLPSTPNQHQL
jgi:hypothetical protein